MYSAMIFSVESERLKLMRSESEDMIMKSFEGRRRTTQFWWKIATEESLAFCYKKVWDMNLFIREW